MTFQQATRSLASVVLVSFLSTSWAANNDWINTAGGDWQDTNNWSLGRVPDPTDDVRINAAGTYTVTVGQTAADLEPGSLSNKTILVHNSTGVVTFNFDYTNNLFYTLVPLNGTIAQFGNTEININTPNGGVDLPFRYSQANGSAAMGTQAVFHVHSGTLSVFQLYMASDPGDRSIINVYTGGVFRSASRGRFGTGGTAEININGGRMDWGSDALGTGTGTGRVMVTGGGNLFVTNAGASLTLSIGGGTADSVSGGFGQVFISNGNLIANGQIYLGAGSNSWGELHIHGGNVTNTVRNLGIGAGIFNGAGAGHATGMLFMTSGHWQEGQSWNLGAGLRSLGVANIDGGTVRVVNAGRQINVGNAISSAGEFNLSGGDVFLQSGSWMALGVGSNSVGNLTVTGGRLNIDTTGNGLIVGSNAFATASAVLEGGRVELRTLNVGAGGVLSNRTGGLLQFVGIDNVLGSGDKIVDGGMLSYRNYAALTVSVAAAKFNIVSGSGLQLDSSTNVNIAGTFTLANSAGNFKELSLTGNGPLWRSDNLLVTDGSLVHVTNASNARLISAVDNQGTIFVQDSTVTWLNTVNIGGRYISDSSTHTVNEDVTVDLGGTIEGGIGDLFDFKKNLLTASTNHTGFALQSSEVRFSGGGNHTNAITGDDFGTNGFFSANNFGYGQLSLGSASDHIYFTSGNDASSNALYAQFVDLLGTTNNVANLHAPTGINIYYLLSEHDTRNAYLMDLTYTLGGGGLLLPAIPEPSITALVFLAALPLLLRRK